MTDNHVAGSFDTGNISTTGANSILNTQGSNTDYTVNISNQNKYCEKCGGFISGVWSGSIPPIYCLCNNTHTAPEQGWQCPICKTVYAPHVHQCKNNHELETNPLHKNKQIIKG